MPLALHGERAVYELTTGEVPFRGVSAMAVAGAIREIEASRIGIAHPRVADATHFGPMIRRRWIQFSLRGFLIAVTIGCLLLPAMTFAYVA